MERDDLLAFLRAQRWAVEASVSVHGTPQAAVMGVAITDDLEIVFDTSVASRKTANLRRNPRIALVIGWDDARTVQLEGLADEPRGAELERLKATYFARFPDGPERAAREPLTYFRVRPRWARVSDFTGPEPTVTLVELSPPRRAPREPRAVAAEPELAPEPSPPVVEAVPDAEPAPESAPAPADDAAFEGAAFDGDEGEDSSDLPEAPPTEP